MEDNNRNLILAMVLSMLVVLVWFTFFAPEPPAPPPETEVATDTQAGTGGVVAPAPGLDGTVAAPALTGPQDPSAAAGRVAVKSPAVEGSISLAGGRIDDLLLTQYRETLEADSPFVRLLSPTDASFLQTVETGSPVAPGGVLATVVQKPYYAVYGWSPGAGTDPAAVPNAATIWELESGETLTPESPVTLRWDNGQGQIFRRSFALDDKYLFTVTQSVENTADTPFTASPYGIIARHGQPDTQNFFVLHEGAIGMTDGELHETSYKNIARLDAVAREGRADITEVAENGWIGFTDKYWMTTLAPAPGHPFTAVIKYAEGADIYQAETRFPTVTVASGQSASSESYLFAGAKEWETIRHYQESPGIQRFVDSIDWGWFYFLTKPIFRLLHWLHGMIG
ncbi:MAG: membrane protein insertase YidC, partial [Paracoccus sp. (in: a-proteobacteria)]|nr:membrane protein insertase YidC [Paracoccus sp. (in: a-proteobacteria)]